MIPVCEDYVSECKAQDGDKEGSRFPNLAGFCRRLGVGIASLDPVEKKFPEQYWALLAILEDEALNSDKSVSLINAYIKERINFKERNEGGASLYEDGIRLVFEHDIIEDGS